MKIAIFASGNGSNFEAVVKATEEGHLPGVEVALLVCDKPGAFVLERAQALGVPSFTFDPKAYLDKAAFETEIVKVLGEAGVSFIVLAGYMKLIGSELLEAYAGKMINLHPSLLPSFTGKDAIGQALAYGVKVTGVTVHFVDAGLDTGPIIKQVPVEVQQDDTSETLTARIHAMEHQVLIQAMRDIACGKLSIEGRKVMIQN